MKKLLFAALLCVCLNACSNYKKHYVQIAPAQYAKTTSVSLFEYTNSDLALLHKTLFDDYTVIGKSSFEGTYENPEKLVSYAKSIGTDLLVTNRSFLGAVDYYEATTTPVYRTSAYYGQGAGYYSGAGTYTTYTLKSMNIYRQEALFLKNADNIVSLWEKKEKDYPKTEESAFDGIWTGAFYDVLVYKSNENIVGFISSKIESGPFTLTKVARLRERTKIGNLKFLFNYNDKKGIFITDEAAPYPAWFSINQNEDIVIELPGNAGYLLKKKH